VYDVLTYKEVFQLLVGLISGGGLLILGHHLKRRREDMKDLTEVTHTLKQMTIEELSDIKASQAMAKISHNNIDKKLDVVDKTIDKLYERTEQNGKNIVKLETLIKKNGTDIK